MTCPDSSMRVLRKWNLEAEVCMFLFSYFVPLSHILRGNGGRTALCCEAQVLRDSAQSADLWWGYPLRE